MAHHRLIGIIIVIALVLVLTVVMSAYLMEVHFGFGVYLVLGLLPVVYFLLPVIFYCSPLIQRQMIFMNIFHWSFGRKYFEPSRHNISGGRTFHLSSQPGVKIGVWHILPKSIIPSAVPGEDLDWDAALGENGKPIIIYFHGNMGTRASGHRLDLYRLLQDLDFHVIAFDYRRFGNSTSSVPPSESGLVADSLCVYEWVRHTLGENSKVPVFFWGHSLGTGVSVHLAAKVLQAPNGIILEAPFTSMADAVLTSISSIIFRPLPDGYRKWLLASPLKRNDLAFESELHIQKINIPILILHATSDLVVPYKLGEKLYDVARKTRPNDSGPIFFKTFKGLSRSSAHVFICKEPDLLDTFTVFTNSCSESQKNYDDDEETTAN